MCNDWVYANGIESTTGKYLLPPQTVREVARVALGQPLGSPSHVEQIDTVNEERAEGVYGPLLGDAAALGKAGWGVVFSADLDPKVKDRLRPLLDLRKEQSQGTNSSYYHEFVWPAHADNTLDDSFDFLAHYNGGITTSNPETVPFYLMLVGSPEALPFALQFGLDVNYAVGRLWFEKDGGPDFEAFSRYAEYVVWAETHGTPRPQSAAFFGVRHEGDPATEQGADMLVAPLHCALRGALNSAGWTSKEYLRSTATKDTLRKLLGGGESPALLFAACHGLGLDKTDDRQTDDQGALLCDEWPGPVRWTGRGRVPIELAFAARDVVAEADLLGAVVILFACYGGGTPAHDSYPSPRLRGQTEIARRPFLAALPQALLSRGALAVISHVDRAWPYSFHWMHRRQENVATYARLLGALVKGERVGWAIDDLNRLYATFGAELTEMQKRKQHQNREPDPARLAFLYTATGDARAFVVLGDPAVRFQFRPGAVKDPDVISPSR